MRLLNVRSGKVEEFFDEHALPRYAVLSHTWGPEEISLQDWSAMPKDALRNRQGYFKIKYLRYQAIQDGLEWVWIDTCCIDRRSSAEVEEAINSMFGWYARAVVCYAYLEDIAQPVLGASLADALHRSRWFTRGWTLQELLAPPEVVFYSTGWDSLGSKTKLAPVLARFVGVDADVLVRGRRALACGVAGAPSVARRMSWAAGRRTSRPEDVAYCLLGIFDVNMPLMYGEGATRAFRRLQVEIMRAYPTDHTLFAWGDRVVAERSDLIPPRVLTDESAVFRWVETEPLHGLLADSPADFGKSADLVPMSVAAEMFYYGGESGVAAAAAAMNGHHHPDSSSQHRGCAAPPKPSGAPGGGGVLAELPLLEAEAVTYHWAAPKVAQLRWGRLAVLFCHRRGKPQEQLAVALTATGPASYGRTRELIAGDFHAHVWQTGAADSGPSRFFVGGGGGGGPPETANALMAPRDMGHGDLVLRRWIVGNNEDLVTGEFRDERAHSFSPREGLLRVSGSAEGPLLWSISVLSETETLCIFIKREPSRATQQKQPQALTWGESASNLFSGLAGSMGALTAGGGNKNSAETRNSASSILSGMTSLGATSNGTTAASSSQGEPQLGFCSIELWPLSRNVHPAEESIVDDTGTTWFPHAEDETQLLALARREALYRHVFKSASDTWLSPAIGAALPMLTARVDRLPLGDGGAVVDVVDVVATFALSFATPLAHQSPRFGYRLTSS